MRARLLPILLAPALALSASQPSRTINRQEPLAFGANLWIHQVDGQVDVQTWDKAEVALVADFYDGNRNGKAVSCDLKIEKTNGGLKIEVVEPKVKITFGNYTSPKCNLTLKVPRKLHLGLRSVDGDVKVAGLEGSVDCHSVDGDITLENLQGDVKARAVDGDIHARSLKSRLNGGTVDGNIFLEGVSGGIDINTVDGDIQAKNLDGWGEGLSFGTVDGKVDLILGQAKGQIEARVMNGRLDIEVPGLETIEKKEGRFTGKLPGRDQKIQIKTMDGNIRVR